MPRRNSREQYEPADLTVIIPGAQSRLRIGDQWTPFSEKERKARRDIEDARRRRQQEARLNRGIDWSICLVPGCGGTVSMRCETDKDSRDHRLNLPLCVTHLAAAYSQAAPRYADKLLVDALAQVLERREAMRQSQKEATKKAWLSRTDGWIYYLRQNGLIKVGWTRDIDDRIRSYGPGVEVLVVYEGTRDDETNLHRQLKPARAMGHEWYEDGPILADFIAVSLEQHGKPARTFGSWTKPKQIVAGKRVKRSA